MSKKQRIREKRRMARQRKAQLEKDTLQEQLDSIEEEEEMEFEDELEDITDDEENVQKDYFESDAPFFHEGPTSFEELDEYNETAEKAEQVRETSYDVQTLVRNILNRPDMTPVEKGTAIKAVGNEFGTRVQSIMDRPPMRKDMDVLEMEALLAKESRIMSPIEKVGDWLQKKKLSYSGRESLPDSAFALVVNRDGKKIRKYPIHDKAHVRNALARAAQQIKAGGEAAADAKAALPKIRAAAKKMGIGMDEKSMEKGLVIIEKDAEGGWRWVGMPSNNFLDRQGDIISEEAHLEYVEWVHKNMDLAPVSMSWHTPETVRENRCDYVDYVNGFLIASGPLTETEARALLEVQKEVDLGMSIGGFAISRDAADPRVISKYRAYEFSDLWLEKAANPFTTFEALTKEDDMDKKAYLAKILGSEELAEKFIQKAGVKQEELRAAGVTEKEDKGESAGDETAEVVTATTQPTIDMKQIVDQVLKEMDVPGLEAWVTKANESIEKVPVLEGLIQDLMKSQDETLAEMIAPPAGSKHPWSGKRASEQDETLVKEDDETDKKLKESTPGIPEGSAYWLSQETGTVPLQGGA